MVVVIDANNIIHREILANGVEMIYTTSSVVKEVKDEDSKQYLEANMFRITLRDPMDEYIEYVRKTISSELLYVSSTDIDVVALTLQLSEEIGNQWISADNINEDRIIRCITRDNGMRNVLNKLGLLEAGEYVEKKFKLRCYACSKMYDRHVDFCKECGYNTITRVTVLQTDEGEKVMLKKNYMPRVKILKGDNGVEIIAADQKEYIRLVNQRERVAKYQNKCNFFD